MMHASNMRIRHLAMKTFSGVLITVFVINVACGKPTHSTPVSNSSPAQSSSPAANDYPNAKRLANELNEATLTGNYEKAADLTYPRLIELMGGRAKYIASVRQGMKETQSDRFRILSNIAADPQDVIVEGKNVYAIVPTTMKIRVAEGELVGQSCLIGVSPDNGKSWTFVDCGNGNNEQLRILFPSVSAKLKPPHAKPPVLHRTP